MRRLEEIIGAKVRRGREGKGLTQEALGGRLEQYLGRPWPRQAVWSAERGDRDFNAVELCALALVLDKPIGWFFVPETPGERFRVGAAELDGNALAGKATGGPQSAGGWAREALLVHGEVLVDRSHDAEELVRQLGEVVQSIKDEAVSAFAEGARGRPRKRSRR